MDEFDLIRRYFAPLVISPGADDLRDDVAEIAPGLIATKDAIVEGIHFLPDDPLETVAQKLVRVNVSDIIAELKSGHLRNIAERSGRLQDGKHGLEELRKDGYM